MVYIEPKEITRAKELFQEGQFTEAFLLVEQFESKNGLTKNEEIACSVTKCSFYYRLGEKQEFFKNFEKVNQASNWVQDDLLLIDVYLEMANGKIWYRREKLPDYEGSLELIGKCERLLENLTQISKNEHDKRRLAIEWTKAIAYSEKGLKERFDSVTPALKERLEHELSIIKNMGFTSYFLIVWDFIHYGSHQSDEFRNWLLSERLPLLTLPFNGRYLCASKNIPCSIRDGLR